MLVVGIFIYLLAAIAVTAVVIFVGSAIAKLIRNNKNFLAMVAVITVVAVIAAVVFGGVFYGALAAELRSAFIVDINQDTRIITMLDSCGLSWEYELEDNIEICELDIYDLMIFELVPHGDPNKISDDAITTPQYSGVRVDRQWADRLISQWEGGELIGLRKTQ